MPVTRWQAQHDGQEWGAGGDAGVVPEVLAAAVQGHAGEARVTPYGKPYTIDPTDPQSVYDYFDSEIDPSGDRETVIWDYQQEPWETTGDIVF